LNGLAPDRETQLELAERIVKDRSRVTGTS
jgi:hypothetical protein